MPPNISDSPLAISVTLAPVRSSGDARTITLKPGEPFLIGRASKSNVKNLEPRRDNALFDCPVISREHAELRASFWDLVEKQVTITDKGSMHGTRVNGAKLRKGEPKILHPGDTIQFGERVTRGESAHEGVLVSFSLSQSYTQDSNTLATRGLTTNPTRGYQLHYSDEESDYDDDDDNVSIVSDGDDAMEVSSAKITPKQAKAGSQEQPIDLDEPDELAASQTHYHTTTQASKTLGPRTTHVLHGNKLGRTEVQDSLDANASIIVPESLLPPPCRRVTSDTFSCALEEESDDEDAFVSRNTALRDGDANDVDDDGDASDLDRLTQSDDFDDKDSMADPTQHSLSPDSIRAASPELRSSGQERAPAPVASADTYMPPPPVPTNSTYNTPFDNLFAMGHSSQQPLAYPTTFPKMFDCSYSQPAPLGTSHSESSRWDKLPDAHAMASLATAREYYQPPSFYQAKQSYYAEPPFSNSRYSYPEAPNDDYTLPSPPAVVRGFTGYSPQSPKVSGQLESTTRIAIPDIVEREVVGVDNDSSSVAYGDFAGGGARSYEEAKSMAVEADALNSWSPVSSPIHSKTGSAGTKRKASEEEHTVNAGGLDIPPQFTSSATMDGPATTPAQKRVKISNTPLPPSSSRLASASSIAASIAKYAGAASVGGAGMLFFLCSPASEQLQNWLS